MTRWRSAWAIRSRRGQANGTRAAVPGSLIVQGLAPLAELASCQTRLNAMTAGERRYTLVLSHYDAMPPNTQAALVGAYQAGDEAD